MRTTISLAAGALVLLALAAIDTTVADQGKKGPLKQVLQDFGVDDAWIYEDLDRGFAEARRTGKPLLVSFR